MGDAGASFVFVEWGISVVLLRGGLLGEGGDAENPE
jgi:hypothetical protein